MLLYFAAFITSVSLLIISILNYFRYWMDCLWLSAANQVLRFLRAAMIPLHDSDPVVSPAIPIQSASREEQRQLGLNVGANQMNFGADNSRAIGMESVVRYHGITLAAPLYPTINRLNQLESVYRQYFPVEQWRKARKALRVWLNTL